MDEQELQSVFNGELSFVEEELEAPEETEEVRRADTVQATYLITSKKEKK